jgi:hypothetical protein
MKLTILMNKYSINEDQVDLIASSMMENLDLTETMARLNGILNQEQIFAVASAFCKSEFGEPIDDVAPIMVMERMQINELKLDETKNKINEQKELKRLRAIEEDLILYEAEQILKVAL